MKLKTNSRFIILLLSLFFLITSIILYNIYKSEKAEYENRNDFVRASTIMTLSYNKEFNFFYPTLRLSQSLTTEPKITEGELILDFAQSDMIPILGFLKQANESENIINAFDRLGNFISDYNLITINLRENIFVKQQNGKYFKEEKGIYTYFTKKKVISRNGFKALYLEYLQSLNQQNVDEYFAKKLKNTKEIANNYSSNEIKTLINNNDFYEKYENDIVNIISKDIIDFCDYISKEYFYLDDEETLSPSLKKAIDSEEISINFKMKKHDRIYSSASKYETHNYTLDLDDVFSQIEKYNYPKMYF